MSEPRKKRKLTYYQKLLIAILFSLWVHLVFLFLHAFPYTIIFPEWAQTEPVVADPKPEVEEPLVFELVDTPDDAKPPAEPKETRYISDKSAMAQNEPTSESLPIGDAFADGNFDVSEYTLGDANETMEGNPQTITPPPETSEPREKAQEREPMESQLTENKPSKSKIQFRSYYDNPSREAFLRQFQEVKDRRPLRRNKPLRRQTDTRSKNIGGFSLDTYAWNWAPYLQHMRDKVNRNLFPPAAFTRLGVISGESLIRFKVFRDGHVEDIEVLNYDGHRSLMETSINALKGSDPFKPLPRDFPMNKEFLGVTAHFQYFITR